MPKSEQRNAKIECYKHSPVRIKLGTSRATVNIQMKGWKLNSYVYIGLRGLCYYNVMYL